MDYFLYLKNGQFSKGSNFGENGRRKIYQKVD